MKATFMGHQSWIVETSAGCVFFDPVLSPSFGHSSHVQFPVFPPRAIRLESLPPAAAVVISHEHHDHFHLPSLKLLYDRGARRALVGEFVPSFVAEFLVEIGYEVQHLRSAETVCLADVAISAFQCDRLTPTWESRSYQWLVEDGVHAVFNAVDAHVSDAAAKHSRAPRAGTLIVANNSQVPPIPAYANMLDSSCDLPEQSHRRRAHLLRALIDHPRRAVPQARRFLICGSGFLEPRQGFGAFLDSDNRRLAELFSELRPGLQIEGPLPGTTFDLASGEPAAAGFVDVDRAEERRQRELAELSRRGPRSLRPFQPLTNRQGATRSEEEAIVDRELRALASMLPLSDFGKFLNHCGCKVPLLFRFIDEDRALHRAYDVSRGAFIRDDAAGESAMERYPWGIEMALHDFVSLAAGRVQVWDLINVATRSWGDGDETINTFLFSAYGEHCRPDLTRKLLASAMALLR